MVAKMEYGVGSGYVVYNRAKEFSRTAQKLTDTTTVFQAEVTAINEAADYLISLSNHRRFDHVKILSDSRAALTALSSCQIKSLTVKKRQHSTKQPKTTVPNRKTSLDQSTCRNTRKRRSRQSRKRGGERPKHNQIHSQTLVWNKSISGQASVGRMEH